MARSSICSFRGFEVLFWIGSCLLMTSPALPVTPREDDRRIEVGLRKQLFVDDYVIAERVNVSRELGCVTKANDGRPIFTEGAFYGTVLYDEEKFKMWYRQREAGMYGYAESADGFKWQTRARVSGIPFAGDVTLAVMIDPHETDADHRYKAAFNGAGQRAALAHSGDGIHWTPYNHGEPVTGRAADTYNHLIWDEDSRVYRLFTRTDFGAGGGGKEIRGTRGMVNPDLKADPTGWKTIRNWIFDREGPDEYKRRQIYALADWIYHGVHFALMAVYEWPDDLSEGPFDYHRRHERNILNFYIATSRDGDSWDLSWVYANKPIVPRGGDGAFDKDRVFPSSSVVTHDDRHWLYYYGANERHGTEGFDPPLRTFLIGLATLRLDGFVCLEARDGPGIVTTKPFKVEGSRLEVNADGSKGEVRVEVLDPAGQPLPGFASGQAKALRGVDGLRIIPEWDSGTSFSALRGRTVRLRFLFNAARIYAFQVQP